MRADRTSASGRTFHFVAAGGLAFALLMPAICGPAYADQDAIAPLVKPLNLVAYRAGTIPPPFGGRTPAARPYSLANLRGKVVIVNFWASWCAECRPEMPALERLHRDLASRGLVMIGINAREEPAIIQRYAKALGLTFPLIVDTDGKINALYGVVGLPATFIIGRDGRAVAFAVGTREWASAPARALIEALLVEPAARVGTM
jgi:cytochrome c biogenesis protein CcmG/thiol:disulfide interchange protein DsbE